MLGPQLRSDGTFREVAIQGSGPAGKWTFREELIVIEMDLVDRLDFTVIEHKVPRGKYVASYSTPPSDRASQYRVAMQSERARAPPDLAHNRMI